MTFSCLQLEGRQNVFVRFSKVAIFGGVLFVGRRGQYPITCHETSSLGILTKKKRLKLNSSTYEKYKHGHLGRQYIKLTLFKRFQNCNRFSKKNKVVTGKTPLFVIGPFCSCHSICLNIGF